MRLLSMHMKYGPWKVTLIEAWKAEFSGVAVSRCPQSDPERLRAARLLRVLRRMCSARSDIAGDEPWVASVGKNVTHCSGPLALCLSLGIIKKIQGKKQAKITEIRKGKKAKVVDEIQGQKGAKLSNARVGVAASRCSSSSAVLRLGVHGCPYRLCSIKESVVAVKQLQSWVVLADRLGDTAAPRTCRQWISAYKRMHGIMYETQPRHIKPGSR